MSAPLAYPQRSFLDTCQDIGRTFEREADDPWRTSPHAWIKELPPRAVGAAGERIVAQYLSAHGVQVGRSPDSEADRTIAGVRVEVKTSTQWKSGFYCFQQLRDQDYEYVVLLGICPEAEHMWVIPKAVLREHAIKQHGGKEKASLMTEMDGLEGERPVVGAERSTAETMWLRFDAETPPEWLQPFGGRPDDVVEFFQGLQTQRRRAQQDEMVSRYGNLLQSIANIHRQPVAEVEQEFRNIDEHLHGAIEPVQTTMSLAWQPAARPSLVPPEGATVDEVRDLFLRCLAVDPERALDALEQTTQNPFRGVVRLGDLVGLRESENPRVRARALVAETLVRLRAPGVRQRAKKADKSVALDA